MSNTWLNDAAPKQLFKDKPLQLLMFEERIKFINNGIINNKITFSSSYFCYDFLPQQIIMESIKGNGDLKISINRQTRRKAFKGDTK